jgi:cytoskeletal protein RodZ
MKRRTSQGGSVASFVVIGVILVAGLLSAVYFVNQRGQQARKEQTISATSTKKPTTKPITTSNTSTTKTTVATPTKSTTQTKTKTADLPATGIETSIGSLTSVFLLSASLVAYMMSRRMLEHSL